jgi:hypothetical protein
MLLFHLVIHEIQVTKPFNYRFGFCCEEEHYNLDTFPFGDAIKDWIENKEKYAMDF